MRPYLPTAPAPLKPGPATPGGVEPFIPPDPPVIGPVTAVVFATDSDNTVPVDDANIAVMIGTEAQETA